MGSNAEKGERNLETVRGRMRGVCPRGQTGGKVKSISMEWLSTQHSCTVNKAGFCLWHKQLSGIMLYLETDWGRLIQCKPYFNTHKSVI